MRGRSSGAAAALARSVAVGRLARPGHPAVLRPSMAGPPANTPAACGIASGCNAASGGTGEREDNMRRYRFVWLLLVLAVPAVAQKKPADVFTDADKAGPDFKIQGEYQGAVANKKYGAQVVALGDGKFDIYFLAGGLPGAGWDGKTRQRVSTSAARGKVLFSTNDWNGEVGNGQLIGETADKKLIGLKRVERKSPTLGEKPPQGAVVLFNGTNADEWANGKLVEGNLLRWGTQSKKGFATG